MMMTVGNATKPAYVTALAASVARKTCAPVVARPFLVSSRPEQREGRQGAERPSLAWPRLLVYEYEWFIMHDPSNFSQGSRQWLPVP